MTTKSPALVAATAALAGHLDRIVAEAEFMAKFAKEAAQGLREDRLLPDDVARASEALQQDPDQTFDATLSFFSPAPNGIEIKDTGPSRFHLEGGLIAIHTTDGLKTFGKGWLLISEPEYAELKLGYRARTTERTPALTVAEGRRLDAGQEAYRKFVDSAGIHSNRFPSWSELAAQSKEEWCDRAAREAETS